MGCIFWRKLTCVTMVQHCILFPLCYFPGIRNALLESDDHTCPYCGETGQSPDGLAANKFLRQAVKNYHNDTGFVIQPPSLSNGPPPRQRSPTPPPPPPRRTYEPPPPRRSSSQTTPEYDGPKRSKGYVIFLKRLNKIIPNLRKIRCCHDGGLDTPINPGKVNDHKCLMTSD